MNHIVILVFVVIIKADNSLCLIKKDSIYADDYGMNTLIGHMGALLIPALLFFPQSKPPFPHSSANPIYEIRRENGGEE